MDTRDTHLSTIRENFEKGKDENEKVAQQSIDELIAKHEKEIEDFKTEFEEKWSQKNPGFTRGILDRIRARDTLCKKKKFKEAQVIQDEIDDLKDEHMTEWNTRIKQKTFEDELKNLKNKQNMELNVLKEKLKIYQDKFEAKMKKEDKVYTNVYDVKEKKLITDLNKKKKDYFKYNH